MLGLVRVARQAGLRVATLAEGWAPPLAPGPPQSQRSAGNTDRPAEGDRCHLWSGLYLVVAIVSVN